MKARVRGIYSTALTQLFLDEGHDVVDASPPIRRRFDDEFASGIPDANVETTDDRLGVGVAGDPDAVAAATDLVAAAGIDAFVYEDPTPSGGVFDGEVTETLGGGAVVDLGVDVPGSREVEGYLPYGNADDRVSEGDAVRVQVTEPAAPWAGQRPELDTELRAVGQLVTLEPGEGQRVESYDEAAGRELAGMTDLLGLEPPEGWRIVWHQPAVDADMGALETALERAVDRAERVEAATDDAVGDPGPLTRPVARTWVRFGRECRFGLDEHRRAVATTMPGHHRVKAGSRAASAGVDLAEALCEFDDGAATDEGDFPFATVCDVFGPAEGDRVTLEHGKPDGRNIVLGEGTVTEREPDGSVTVEREMSPGGTYDALGVEREAGDTAVTKVKEGRWWYPTVYRDAEGTAKGTYVNVCTPVEVFPDAVSYVDLHVDVVKHRDGTVERVDDDLLDEAVAAGTMSEEVAEKARSVASALENAL